MENTTESKDDEQMAMEFSPEYYDSLQLDIDEFLEEMDLK